jgi:5-methylcytosine-specific restriction endonuclease McrA
VQIVEEYEDRTVSSVTMTIKVPSIVRYIRGKRKKDRPARFSRDNIWIRDNGQCQYCGRNVPRHNFTFEHVVPKSRGGKTTWQNVVVACIPCNQKKADSTPAEAGMKLLREPIQPKRLPNILNITLRYENGMPVSWKAFLRDVEYWHGELVQDK